MKLNRRERKRLKQLKLHPERAIKKQIHNPGPRPERLERYLKRAKQSLKSCQ